MKGLGSKDIALEKLLPTLEAVPKLRSLSLAGFEIRGQRRATAGRTAAAVGAAPEALPNMPAQQHYSAAGRSRGEAGGTITQFHCASPTRLGPRSIKKATQDNQRLQGQIGLRVTLLNNPGLSCNLP